MRQDRPLLPRSGSAGTGRCTRPAKRAGTRTAQPEQQVRQDGAAATGSQPHPGTGAAGSSGTWGAPSAAEVRRRRRGRRGGQN